jgi:hypothetical protein
VTPDAIQADHWIVIRDAAKEWRRVHIIDESGLSAVHSLYPDDRVRVGPFFRILLFILTLLGAFFCSLAVFIILDHFSTDLHWDLEWYALTIGGLLLAATDYQIRILKRCQGGTEAATSALGLLLIVFGAYESIHWDSQDARWLLLFWAILFTCACIRWGYEVYGMIGAVLFFTFLARFPGPGLCWIVTSSLLLLPVHRLSENPRLAPSHRRAFSMIAIVLLAALYTAVHIWIFDHGEIHDYFGPALPIESVSVKALLRGISIVLTGLVPCATLFYALRTRRQLYLNAGLVMAIISLATLRFYVHVAPLWLLLILAGAILLAGALFLRRWLTLGPNGERYGFTADPLLQDVAGKSTLETAAGMVTFTPSPGTPTQEPGFQGGGGASGGAGAGGAF